MSYKKEDYISRLETALQDSAEKLQSDDKIRILSQAVILYSKDRPRELVHEMTGDGTSYDFAMPTLWIDGFSGIKDGKIEYPADDYQNPEYIESIDWTFYKKLVATVTTKFFRFLTFIPSSGKIARYTFTVPHTLDDATSTIDDADIEAVVALTAALCFWTLAAKFAQSTDPTMEADVIDYQRKSELYVSLAKDKLSTYNSLMGLGEEAKGAAAASAGVAIADLDMAYPWGGDYLTHPIRQR